jgi:hypothetical protein
MRTKIAEVYTMELWHFGTSALKIVRSPAPLLR